MKIDVERRDNIRAYHSATHLLHESLRRVLGTHVIQKGSLVEADRLRFDFSHIKPISPEEINKIETFVNSMVDKKSDVKTRIMTPKEAVDNGALALFGEKYGNEVEIVSGGQKDGADGYAKKFALEFGMKYVEFPPAHYSWNMHCKLPATKYNKPYYVTNYFKRNKQIAEYSDIIVAFIQKGVESRGTMNTIHHAEKQKKLIKKTTR